MLILTTAEQYVDAVVAVCYRLCSLVPALLAGFAATPTVDKKTASASTAASAAVAPTFPTTAATKQISYTAAHVCCRLCSLPPTL